MGDLGNRNTYVKLDNELHQQKVKHWMESFAFQRTKHWFAKDTFFSILTSRGIESGGSDKYGEGFFVTKLFFD